MGQPRGVILIHADTLRRDHLGVYGHDRETAPQLRQWAADGALFRQATVQGTWTKVSTPSIMTSLYPLTHGVRNFPRPASGGGRDAGRAVSSRRVRDGRILVGVVHGPVHQPASGIRRAPRIRFGRRRTL